MKKVRTLAVVASLFGAFAAQAAPIMLDFEGLTHLASINNFYNGGTDSAGASGPDFGIAFTSAAVAVIDEDAGGGATGNFANEPSPSTVLGFANNENAYINVAAGFGTGFSFFFASDAIDARVEVYSQLGGMGDLLGSLELPRQARANDCTGDPGGADSAGLCNWDPAGVAFAGMAYSVRFVNTADLVGFDNMTFGAVDPIVARVPTPGSLLLAGLALAGLAVTRRKAGVGS